VATWSVVVNSDLNCQHFLSARDRWIIPAANLPSKEDDLAGENSVWAIWNLRAALLDPSNKYLPTGEKIGTGNGTEILDLCTKIESGRFFSSRRTHDYLPARIFPGVIETHIIHSDVGSIGSIERLVGCGHKMSSQASLPGSDRGVGEEKDYCNNLRSKLFAIPGFLLIAGSVILLYKLWWKVCFDSSADRYVIWFVVQFIASLGMFMSGGMLLLLALIWCCCLSAVPAYLPLLGAMDLYTGR
jgi:hypothetical protein